MPGRLRDVASRAGVALSTASLALKGGPHVSAHVRGRVIEAARALHYDLRRLGATAAPPFPDAASQPDHLTAVLLVPARFHAVYNTYFAPLVAAVRAAARELGFELFLAPTEGGPPDAPLHTILADVHNPVDGILLMGVSDGPADLAWLAGWGKPAVLLSRHLEGAAARLCSSVGIDYEAAIRLPVDHLVAL